MSKSPSANQNSDGGQKPPSLEFFHNLHQGETCLLVGNAKSLQDFPLDFLHKYPSLAANTIFRYKEFKPTYYVAVDSRVRTEFSEEINVVYKDIPKFLPTPNLDKWQGENIYRWYHRPGLLWPYNEKAIWPREILSNEGITYQIVMHVQMQLAYYMGFSRMLMVGVTHDYPRQHFWGVDEDMPNVQEAEYWAIAERGYKELADGMGREVINLTPDTRVTAIARGDWKDFA